MTMPAVLLVFANDWSDSHRQLRSLLGEGKAIGKALAPLIKTGLNVLPPVHNATVDDVIGAFRDHHDQIRVFHFGGHASGSTLLFEDDAGAPTQAHAGGLAGYLGEQPGLVLVFLNGCCTEPQVRRLRAAGVKAVVATTRAIEDAVAAEFAEAFYAELAVRPLREAFDTAAHAVKTRWGDDPRAITRDIVTGAERDVTAPGEPQRWPWIIDCDPSYDAWTPRTELARAAQRARRKRLVICVATLGMTLSSLLALSADARRTACRAPGLGTLCAAVAVGNVPTADEQARWEHARAQRSGDELRGYLQAYPTGAYADEARARLAGCAHLRGEVLGPAQELRYPLTINANRLDLRATEAEARDDAMTRGHTDAATGCALLRYAGPVLSAAVDPHIWKCIEDNHRFTCGFDGQIVCRVRERMATDDEHCHDEASPAPARAADSAQPIE